MEGVLDSGDYLGNLEKCLEMIDYDKFRKEIQPKARAEGKHVGIGVVAFTEGTSVGPYEGARVTIGTNGKVSVSTGISTQGQGHFTVFAQIVAEQLNVKLEDVKVITGDTDHFHWGAGTFASRGATVTVRQSIKPLCWYVRRYSPLPASSWVFLRIRSSCAKGPYASKANRRIPSPWEIWPAKPTPCVELLKRM